MPLPPATRAKLAKVLGLLGSPHHGERAAAGLLADKLVKEAGATWPDLLGGSPEPEPLTAPPFVADLELALRNLDWLTSWEANFVRSIQTFTHLSPRQHETIGKIARGLRLRGRG